MSSPPNVSVVSRTIRWTSASFGDVAFERQQGVTALQIASASASAAADAPGDGDPGAAVEKRRRNRPADAPRAAGDDGDFSVKLRSSWHGP